MPAQRPRAAFEPLSPDFDVAEFVNSTPDCEFAPRILCDAIDKYGLEDFQRLVSLHVIKHGIPLVVQGFNERLDKNVFSEKWLNNHYSTKSEFARDLVYKKNLPLTIGHYLKHMPLLADKYNAHNYKAPDNQRLYLKDIDCPKVWQDHLKKVIPPCLFYLNNSPHPFQGPGSGSYSTLDKSGEYTTSGKEVGRAGDLMSCLPSNMRAENLMCYIGHEGTYTPAHQEMCASLGQNLMVDASDGSIEHGKATRPGSSIWFMTETKHRDVVSEYWMSTLGHDINIEDHFAQINAWKAAPFRKYIVEQKPGDLILVPPLAAHQVWNRGTRTMKVAWNRTTVETLDLALKIALPCARMVCRDEQYKNKAIVFYSLQHYSALLHDSDEADLNHPAVQILQKDFEHLFLLYTHILLSESFSPDLPKEKNVEFIAFDSNITCSYCRGNIFNRFLTCPWCVSASGEDTYDICMECYAMGRSCACISKLKWAEQFYWTDLTEKHEAWRQQLLGFKFKRRADDEYPSFSAERDALNRKYLRKSLAQICQEQLKKRPWVDMTKPPVKEVEEIPSDSEKTGPARKKRKTGQSDKSKVKPPRCHICKYVEPAWKLASCSYCRAHYCYGSLFRAFNIRPQDTMEMHSWKCPRCEKICSCGACRKDPSMNPFEPKCTLLGHDTRKIADPRSVESLVDFRHSNVRWLKKAAEDDDGRLKKHQEEAEEKQRQLLVDHSIQLELEPEPFQSPAYNPLERTPQTSYYAGDYDDIPVDPALENSILTTPGSMEFSAIF